MLICCSKNHHSFLQDVETHHISTTSTQLVLMHWNCNWWKLEYA